MKFVLRKIAGNVAGNFQDILGGIFGISRELLGFYFLMFLFPSTCVSLLFPKVLGYDMDQSFSRARGVPAFKRNLHPKMSYWRRSLSAFGFLWNYLLWCSARGSLFLTCFAPCVGRSGVVSLYRLRRQAAKEARMLAFMFLKVLPFYRNEVTRQAPIFFRWLLTRSLGRACGRRTVVREVGPLWSSNFVQQY